MIVKISFRQIRLFFLIATALLLTWLVMGHYARYYQVNCPEGQVIVNVSFLAPMNREGTVSRLEIKGGIPGNKISCHTTWLSRNTVQVVIYEYEYPRGLEYVISFRKARAMIPPFTVTSEKRVAPRLAPRPVCLEPGEHVPSRGPVTLVFNTPLDPASFKESVIINAAGSFSPETARDLSHDFSRWVFTPEKRLQNSGRYNIEIMAGLRGVNGGVARTGRIISFIVAPELNITKIYPAPEAPSIWLSRPITIQADQALEEASVQVDGIKGSTRVEGNTVSFTPEDLFLPGTRYQVQIRLVSLHGEELVKKYWFGTTDLGGMRWLDIKLGNPCRIGVYEGSRKIRSFEGWLTIPQEKVPRVTMYEEERRTTSEFDPGNPSPIKYMRLNADIMLHRAPSGEDNHTRLGLPPGYGCILLNKPDMDWIFNNIQPKLMTIVH